ncbi:protein D1-like [Maniola jurtina]|uniref:protein D1-like n=1 Tax=Maniola jurtina TaxID=191418 RepID=UPI001E68DAE7|nr:protein D1-like [Maniola jurtina]XP_045770234.1 protein D1-like [Maniola jurtina]
MYFVICLTILLVEAGLFAVSAESAVAQAFMNDKIVRNIVVKPPTDLITVKYLDRSIYLGTTVEPLTTLNQPEVSYEANDADLYTLLFFGPDLPPSFVPPLTQLIHWGVANIPGQDISKGVAFSTYFPPVPYPDGFPYIFLLFKQNGPIDPSQLPNLSPILSRPQFSYTKFAAKFNLGDPIAGNFMRESYLQIIPEALQELYELQATILAKKPSIFK